MKKKNRFLWPNNDGSAAIEFAIVAPVFLALSMSIMEVGWFYFVNATVNASTTQASRLVRTGQVQLANLEQDGFFDQVCAVVDTFSDCDDALTVDVAVFDDFASLASDTSTATCKDAPQSEIDAIPFEPGGENEIVRVRVCVLYNTLNPAIGVNLSEEGSSVRRIVSSLVFRNEPFERNQGGPAT
ncbi:MAG: TadE/TadG family type IV pilus assembly protein [Pseudomonadota bacterium]